MSMRTLAALGAVAGLVLALTGCGTEASAQRGASFGTQVCGQNWASAPHYAQPFTPRPCGETELSGAGSSFAAPLMADWTQLYRNENKVDMSYQSVGSGAGLVPVPDATARPPCTTVRPRDRCSSRADSTASARAAKAMSTPTQFGEV